MQGQRQGSSTKIKTRPILNLSSFVVKTRLSRVRVFSSNPYSGPNGLLCASSPAPIKPLIAVCFRTCDHHPSYCTSSSRPCATVAAVLCRRFSSLLVFRLVLSYLVLSHLLSSRLCLVLVSSRLVMSLVWSCVVLACLALSCLVALCLSCLVALLP
jgi:hypothetical protein